MDLFLSTQTVPTLSMILMSIAAALSIVVPLGLFFALRKRFSLKVVPMLVGAASFIVFAMILEQILHFLVLRPDANGATALVNQPLLYVLYGIFAAGIFEETGRFVSFHLLKKRYHGVGTGLSYGIGHGGIEAVLVLGLTMVSNLIFSAMINAGMLASLGDTPLVAAQAEALAGTAPAMFLVGGLERIFAIVIHISLSVLVWLSVDQKKLVWLYPAAILLHAAIDIPAALMQTGVLTSIVAVEALVGLSAAALAVLAFFAYKKFNKVEIQS